MGIDTDTQFLFSRTSFLFFSSSSSRVARTAKDVGQSQRDACSQDISMTPCSRHSLSTYRLVAHDFGCVCALRRHSFLTPVYWSLSSMWLTICIPPPPTPHIISGEWGAVKRPDDGLCGHFFLPTTCLFFFNPKNPKKRIHKWLEWVQSKEFSFRPNGFDSWERGTTGSELEGLGLQWNR